MNEFQSHAENIQRLLSITEKLNHVNDLDSLLDQILYNARAFTNADAGTIYLLEGDQLRFAYSQNDTLAQRDKLYNKQIYANSLLPINPESISGYVALTKEPLLIHDAYTIDRALPFSFNQQFDLISNYRTQSILTVPLYTSFDKIVGVMQIINAKNQEENIVPFTEEDKISVSFFASNASVAIEKAKMTREMILRMIKMAELRDPKETGSHVNRVGAYAVEIYQRWAESKKIDHEEVRKTKDILRISAMLHDVGKIAIPDAILKKPAKLDDNEYEIMKTHTTLGGKLFDNAFSAMDILSREVALFHHERWDGKGYPHKLEKEEIPLAGRIVAIADVYDALISKRVYKDSWTEEKVLNYLKEQSGQQFDPVLIDSFLSIYDIIKAIRKRYMDEK